MARQYRGTVVYNGVTACYPLTSPGSISYAMPRSLIYPQYESVPTYRDCIMRRYLIFGSAATALLMYSLDTTAVAVALPNFVREFHAPVTWAGWTVSIYYIAMTMSLPLAGNLSDSFGRKLIFLASLVLFTGSSLACGLSPNIYALIGFRFVQGIGGAAFLPVASGIVSEHFPENRERMIGLFTSIVPIGGLIGPNLGGWIVSSFSWRYIFYINLPIGILLIGMVLWLIRDSKATSRPQVDFAGILFNERRYSFSHVRPKCRRGKLCHPLPFSRRSAPPPQFCLPLLFLPSRKARHQSYHAPRPARQQAFSGGEPPQSRHRGKRFGVFAFLPYYTTSVHKLSTLLSGVIMTPRSLGTIPAAAITAFLLRRTGYRRPIVVGLALTSCAVFLLAPDRLWDIMALLVQPGRNPFIPDPVFRHRPGHCATGHQQRMHRAHA